eukprot:TRINITY_DN3539_c0_g1_i1.p1 TRINITY_DN3539_c0_g1~~TRINITY_DN3539_c0_g1_i1.p1  ORF type:complete len:241 (-),score=37.41 TRINITY_DN3539_c0_g1_i1:883-1584(-)
MVPKHAAYTVFLLATWFIGFTTSTMGQHHRDVNIDIANIGGDLTFESSSLSFAVSNCYPSHDNATCSCHAHRLTILVTNNTTTTSSATVTFLADLVVNASVEGCTADRLGQISPTMSSVVVDTGNATSLLFSLARNGGQPPVLTATQISGDGNGRGPLTSSSSAAVEANERGGSKSYASNTSSSWQPFALNDTLPQVSCLTVTSGPGDVYVTGIQSPPYDPTGNQVRLTSLIW